MRDVDRTTKDESNFVYKTMYELQENIHAGFAVDVPESIPVVSVAAGSGFSSTFISEVNEQRSSASYIMTKKSASATLDSGDLKCGSAFQTQLEALPDTLDDDTYSSHYKSFIAEFGTHIIRQGQLR